MVAEWWWYGDIHRANVDSIIAHCVLSWLLEMHLGLSSIYSTSWCMRYIQSACISTVYVSKLSWELYNSGIPTL